MKYISLLLLFVSVSLTSFAQRNIAMQHLWAAPQVHVLFQGYTVSFTIKDIDKALSLLAAAGESRYDTVSGLDTAKSYALELYAGTRTLYTTPLQPLMQNAVGVFLLLAGHASILNPRHKTVKEVVADIQPVNPASDEAFVHFYDPKTNKLLFSGKMPVSMYNQDLGID